MMEDRSGWPVSSALPVTLHQAFPKDTAEATFWANWSTTALGAFPTAFHWQDGMLAFFCERRTIAARIHSFANAGLGISAIAALRSEGNAALWPSAIKM